MFEASEIQNFKSYKLQIGVQISADKYLSKHVIGCADKRAHGQLKGLHRLSRGLLASCVFNLPPRRNEIGADVTTPSDTRQIRKMEIVSDAL